jgi:DNA topoisomerase-3
MIRITEENKVEFVFDDIDGENGPELLSEKPVMTSFINDEEIFETATGFISKTFLDGDKKALRLNRVILGKDIGRENALQMLGGEKSELIEGFRSSKTKRYFDAYLQLNAKGKMSFSFPPRKPRAKKA